MLKCFWTASVVLQLRISHVACVYVRSHIGGVNGYRTVPPCNVSIFIAGFWNVNHFLLRGFDEAKTDHFNLFSSETTLPEWHVGYKFNIYKPTVIIRMRSLTEMFQLVNRELYLNRNHPSICRTWHGNFSRHTHRSLHGCHPSLLRDPHHSRCTLHTHMCLQSQGESIVKYDKTPESQTRLTIDISFTQSNTDNHI